MKRAPQLVEPVAGRQLTTADHERLEQRRVQLLQGAPQAIPVKVELNREIRSELQPKLRDLLFEPVARRCRVLAPQLVEQFRTWDDGTGGRGEHGEDVRALGWQVDLTPISREQGNFAEHRQSDSRRALPVHREG